MALVCATPHAQAIAETDEPADFRIQADAAPEPGAKLAESEDGVTEIPNLPNADTKLLEGGVHIRPPVLEAFVTVIGVVTLSICREGVPLGLRMQDLQHRRKVAPVVAVETLKEGLHVLLRHHASSISLRALGGAAPATARRLRRGTSGWCRCPSSSRREEVGAGDRTRAPTP